MLLIMSIVPLLLNYASREILIAVGLLVSFFGLLCFYRKWRMRHRSSWGAQARSLKTCLVLGSGGHTTELLRIVNIMGPQYQPRVYILADTDKMSETRLEETEKLKGGVEGRDYEVHRIPRSREVRQSYLSSVFSTIRSILFSVPLMFKIRPELVICNGPGTCVPIAFLGCALDLLRIQNCAIIFIESIARVKSLSLSGEILHHARIADQILVQWEEQKEKYPSVEYIGRL